jgi:hypothetical protein
MTWKVYRFFNKFKSHFGKFRTDNKKVARINRRKDRGQSATFGLFNFQPLKKFTT